MQRSFYLARLIGPLLVVIGLGILFNGDVYRAMADEFLKSHALIYLSGLLALVAGLALVNAHNVWSDDWRLLITILGWLAVIGGTLRILVPQQVEAIGHAMVVTHPGVLIFAGLVVVLVGATLSYFGYYAPVRAAAIVAAARRASARPSRKASPKARVKAARSRRR